MALTVTNLVKRYGEQTAVNNISFTVNKGEIVGFLGPNGAGKSTTMKIITGYLSGDSGSVMIDGVSVGEEPLTTKKRIGYLPEANPLYYDMYVREYLLFTAGMYNLKNAKQKVEEVIRKVGLTPEAHKKTGQLSKGYKQRVGIAAALVHNPDVLILDEPTSGLDPNQLTEIRSVIKDLSREKTVLFSTHIMQEVEAICDRVIIINKGKIVADDNLAALRKNTVATDIIVQFREKVQADIFNGIDANVQAPEILPSDTWKLTTSDPDSVRKQLLQLSIDHNLNIISLRNDNESLENIFRSLTS